MKQISSALHQIGAEERIQKSKLWNSYKNSLQTTSQCKTPAVQRVLDRYGTCESFLLANSPDKQLEICNSSNMCYFGDSPTLSVVRLAYGTNIPEAWLVPQLLDASLFCGLKQDIDKSQMRTLATIIVNDYHWLKIDELLLFFFRFKSAHYLHFYSYFDPHVILGSLKMFINERNRTYEHMEQKRREKEAEEARSKAVTYEEYLRLKEESANKKRSDRGM